MRDELKKCPFCGSENWKDEVKKRDKEIARLNVAINRTLSIFKAAESITSADPDPKISSKSAVLKQAFEILKREVERNE